MRQSVIVPKREMKVRIPANSGLARFFLGPVGRFLVIAAAIVTIATAGVFTYFYDHYSHVVAEKLHVPFANTAKIYAAPESVAVGDPLSPADIAAQLRRSGYTESHANRTGYYQVHPNEIEIFPGPDSYFDQEAGLIKFASGRISQIISLQDNTSRPEYQLEPQLITNVSGASREKRRMVKFHDIPPVLVQAVTSTEDKHFFITTASTPSASSRPRTPTSKGRKEQGASTLSQQLARMFWLDQEKRWTRKMAEMIITLQIEQSLTKEEIFEDYANDVYSRLARRVQDPTGSAKRPKLPRARISARSRCLKPPSWPA